MMTGGRDTTEPQLGCGVDDLESGNASDARLVDYQTDPLFFHILIFTGVWGMGSLSIKDRFSRASRLGNGNGTTTTKTIITTKKDTTKASRRLL